MIALQLVAALLAAATAAAPAPATPAAPAARVTIQATALPGLGGGTEELLPAGARASVLVFFRGEHDRSQAMLANVALCQARLAGKPVRWLGIVPDGSAAPAVRSAVAASGAVLPLAVDTGDAVYGALGLRMHPVVIVLETGRRVAAVEPFHAVDGCELLTARVRRVLGEIGDVEVASAAAPAASPLPGDDDPAWIALRHLRLAEKLLEGKLYKKAHAQVWEAILLSESAEAWAIDGEIFAAERKCPEALRAFQTALAKQPDNARALAGRARCR